MFNHFRTRTIGIRDQKAEASRSFNLPANTRPKKMAGRRQHYLPRFLQRPFRYRSQQDKDYVYAHERVRTYTPSTMGLGQERDFYGHPEESPADENITATESQLAGIVARLQTEPGSVPQIDQARLLAALAVRTRKMRDALEGLVKVTAVEMSAAFKTQRYLRDEVESYWKDRHKLDKLIRGELEKIPALSRDQRDRLRRLATQQWNARKTELTRHMYEAGQALAAEFFNRLDQASAQVADNAFRKIFERDPTLQVRVKILTDTFRFHTFDSTPEDEFILSDCAAVGLRADGEARLPSGLLDEGVPLDAMFLPIAPYRCIAATRRGKPVNFGTQAINRLSASLAHRFFISQSPKPAELELLRQLIGTAEPLASEADLQAIMSDVSLPRTSADSKNTD